jgi:hypothetical protein
VNLRTKVPVEPLDEERLVDIERAVVRGYADALAKPHRAPSRWLVPALCGAAVAAVVAAVAVVKLRPVREIAPPAVAAAPMRFAATASGARVELGDATVDVAPGAAFTVTRPSCDAAWSSAIASCPAGTTGVLVALDGGTVELSVESRTGRAPLVVRAADVDVVVVGTRFTVERGDAVTVQVTEGVVRVSRGGAEVRVAAGQAWSAPVQIAAGAPMPEPRPIQTAAIAPRDTDVGELAVVGDDGGPALRDRDAVVPTAPTARTKSTRDGGGSGGSSGGSGGEAGSGSSAPASKTAELRRIKVKAPVDVDGDPVRAYTALTTTDRRRDGLYGLAFTYRRLGKRAEALRMLDALKDAKGEELDDVLWMRLQILCEPKIDSACRAAASSYVKRFTGNDRSELANRIANEID